MAMKTIQKNQAKQGNSNKHAIFHLIEWVQRKWKVNKICNYLLQIHLPLSLVDSLRHCRQEKGLLVHGRCMMSNHVHILASAKENNLSDTLRDFKKFTSKQIIAAIRANTGESRKEWMLTIFQQMGICQQQKHMVPVLAATQPAERMLQPRLYRTKAELYSSQSC